MFDRFPLALFPPSEHQPYLMGASQSGGTPVAGPPQTADMSTGGYWCYEFVVGRLRSRDEFAAWRAFLARLNSGVALLEVPVLDILQPWPGRAVGGIGTPSYSPHRVPHSDQTPFSDTSLYGRGTPISATSAAAGYAPAWPAPPTPPTQLAINIAAGGGLRGGEYFTVIGPSGEPRMHMIGRIISTAGTVSTVSFVPPLREDIPAGTPIDFNTPRFLGKADIGSIKDAWPRMVPPFQSAPRIRFLESFSPASLGAAMGGLVSA